VTGTCYVACSPPTTIAGHAAHAALALTGVDIQTLVIVAAVAIFGAALALWSERKLRG
jgi:hypothetical protein